MEDRWTVGRERDRERYLAEGCYPLFFVSVASKGLS
jgi:hypothetical protein